MLRQLRPLPLHALVTKSKIQTHPLRNEAQLNCVALRSSLDYEVARRAVKGQDERQNAVPLTALRATREVITMSRKKFKEGATSALTFMAFSKMAANRVSACTGC